MKHSALLILLLFFSTSFVLLGQSTRCSAPTSTPVASAASTSTLNSKFVQFTVSNTTPCTRAFYLFEDGYYSRQLNPNHEFRAGGSYSTQYYVIETYDNTPPAASRIASPVVIPNTAPVGSSTGHFSMGNQSVKITQSWRAVKDNILIYIVAVKHPGGNNNSPASGTITLNLDPSINFTATIPNNTTGAYNNWATQVHLPTSNNPNEVKWDFGGLDFGANNTRYYYVEVAIPRTVKTSNLNTSVTVNYGVLGIAEKTTTSSFYTYPWDPNGIEADHECVKGETPDRQALQYTVHFQNEGTGFANTVQVEVDLGWQHYPETIEIIDASHQLSGVELDPNGFVYFTFPNINLPGTNQSSPERYDLEETSGSFTFSLCSQEMLPTGDQIIASANIYFDYLPPVYAGEAISFIDDYCDYKICENVAQDAYRSNLPIGQVATTKSQSLLAYPNPVKDLLNVEYHVTADQGAPVNIQLYDLSGQKQPVVLFEGFQTFGRYQQNFDLSMLPAGIYMLNIINGDQQETKRLVKMN